MATCRRAGCARWPAAALTPELPTLIESGLPGFVSNGWIGLLAPRATPKPIVSKLLAALVKAVSDPATARNMEKAGGDPESGTPAEFLKLIETDWKNFGEAIRIAKLKAE